MSFLSWLHSLRSALTPRLGHRRHQRRGPARATHRPSLEILEARCVPAQYPNAMVMADFNGDAWLDRATPNLDSNDISVFLGNADGVFEAPQNYATGEYPNTIGAGDFNGDGHLDLVTGNLNAWNVGVISVLLGNGDGTFQYIGDTIWGTSSEGTSPQDVAVGDFDADGNLDLAVSIGGNGSEISVLLGSGYGSFSIRSQLPTSFAPSVV